MERGARLPGLRRARHERALTLRELSERAGVGIDTLSRLETGKQSALMGTVRKLAVALGTEPAELMRPAAMTAAETPPRTEPAGDELDLLGEFAEREFREGKTRDLRDIAAERGDPPG